MAMHRATAAPALWSRSERSDAAASWIPLASTRSRQPDYRLAMIFFDTLAVVASIGAFVPVLLGKETAGQLETVSEGLPKLA